MNWLKSRREELRLSQEEFKARLELAGLNVSRSTVSAWETARVPLPLEDKEARIILAHVLKMAVPTMLEAAGFEISGQYSKAAQQAADIVDRLPPYHQKLALELLYALENTERAG